MYEIYNCCENIPNILFKLTNIKVGCFSSVCHIWQRLIKCLSWNKFIFKFSLCLLAQCHSPEVVLSRENTRQYQNVLSVPLSLHWDCQRIFTSFLFSPDLLVWFWLLEIISVFLWRFSWFFSLGFEVKFEIKFGSYFRII